MGTDLATKGTRTAHGGQARGFSEGTNTNDGIVSPVIAVVTLPGTQTAGKNRAVDCVGELLQAGIEGFTSNQSRQGLQYAELSVCIHLSDQRSQRISCNQAVGVQHDHIIVAIAPVVNEVSDVAGFTCAVLVAATVPDRHGIG